MKKSKILSTLALAALLGAASIPLNIVTASHVYASDYDSYDQGEEEDFGDDQDGDGDQGGGDEDSYDDGDQGDDQGGGDEDSDSDGDQGDDQGGGDEDSDSGDSSAASDDDQGDDDQGDAPAKAGPTINTQAHKAVAIFNKKYPPNSKGRHNALNHHINELNALGKQATAPEDRAAKKYIKDEVHKLTLEMKKAGKKAGYQDHDAIAAYKKKEPTLKGKAKTDAIRRVINILNRDMSKAQKAHDAKEESLLKHEIADFKKKLADAEKAAKAAPTKGKGGKDKAGAKGKGKKGGNDHQKGHAAKGGRGGSSQHQQKQQKQQKQSHSAKKTSKSSNTKSKRSSSSSHKSSSKGSSKHKR